MGVVNVKPEWSTAEAPIDRSGSSARLSWTVLLDGRDSFVQAPITARQAPGIPRVGQRHPTDPTAVCRSVEPKSLSPILWRVTASYATPSGATNEKGESLNPLDAPPEISYDFEQIQQMIDTDLDDKPIVNTAGDPFDPKPEIPYGRPLVRITRNEQEFPGAKARDYAGGRGAINSDAFKGWPPGTVRCRNISGTDQTEGEFAYCRVTYEFICDAEGWQPRPLNIGLREKKDGEMVVIKDKDGQPVSQPVALNKDGTAKEAGGPVERAGPFKVFPEKPFGALGL